MCGQDIHEIFYTHAMFVSISGLLRLHFIQFVVICGAKVTIIAQKKGKKHN